MPMRTANTPMEELRMTVEEKEIVLLLNDVYEKYSSLQQQHHSDMDEFVNALHILQHLVMIRSVRRKYPGMFPMNLQTSVTMDSFNDMSPIEEAISKTIGNALDDNVRLK